MPFFIYASGSAPRKQAFSPLLNGEGKWPLSLCWLRPSLNPLACFSPNPLPIPRLPPQVCVIRTSLCPTAYPKAGPLAFNSVSTPYTNKGGLEKLSLGSPFAVFAFPPMVTVRSFCPISVKDNYVRGAPSQCPRQEIAQDFPLPTCQTPLLEPSRDKWGICFLVLSANPPSFLLELEKWRTLIFFLALNHTHISMIQ